MRPALRRLLASPSALSVLRNCLEAPNGSLGLAQALPCSHCAHRDPRYRTRWSSTVALVAEEKNGSVCRQSPATQHEPKNETIHLAPIRKVDVALRWEDRLQTFEQFEYESDLDTIATRGFRLVDQAIFSNDFNLWLQLLKFRRRTYGERGVATIWNNILKKGIELPTMGPVADEFWNVFLDFALRRRRVLNEIHKYARELLATTGRGWSKFYLKILEHELETVSPYSYQWHALLRNDFPPSLEHLQTLFKKAMPSKEALGVFERIYTELPLRDMYSTTVPLLCREGMYKTAVRWHHLLMRSDDFPPSSTSAKPLLHYLAIYGDQSELIEITKGMVDAGVSFSGSVDRTLKENVFISREIMNRIHGKTHNITPKTIGDSFSARFFATRVFSVDMVIGGLKALGVENIGPLSLRELAARDVSPDAVSRRIVQLQEAGISIGTSTFSAAVRGLAKEGNGELLHSLLISDQHPDALDDWKLQESLLASYRRANDMVQYRRTLAVLTTNLPTASASHETWNLKLRSYATERNIEGIMQTLEGMREAQVTVTSKSSGYIRLCLLSRRSLSRQPPRTDDLPVVVNIWQTILRDGGFLPPIAWREILRRYGMAGRLDELEKLALWLASWYSDPKAKARQMSRTYHRHNDEQDVVGQMLESLPTTHAQHPLRIIFTPQAQEAIVAWGFRQWSSQYTPAANNEHSIPTYPELKTARWAWGLRLLGQLEQCGVYIQTGRVRKACQDKLLMLFGPGESERTVNRKIRARNPFTIEEMIMSLERIWGPTLFEDDKALPPPGTPLRLERIKQRVLGAHRAFPDKTSPRKESGWRSPESLEYPTLFSAG